MQARDLHFAPPGFVGERAQAIWGEVSVGFQSLEAEAAMFFEESLRIEAWSVPGGRQSNWFRHG